jgi:hypothetical protein
MPRKKRSPDEDPSQQASANGVQEGVAVATAPPDGNQAPTDAPPEAVTNRPCKSFSAAISAGVYAEASIWPRELTMDGKTFTVFSVTCRKNYKTDDGWRNTQFFRGSELFILRHLLEAAERWIVAQRVEENPSDLPF